MYHKNMTTQFLNIYEIKARFSSYARQVMKGKSFIIAFRNQPFAEFRPIQKAKPSQLTFGVLKDQFKVPDDFNASVPEFERDFYGE